MLSYMCTLRVFVCMYACVLALAHFTLLCCPLLVSLLAHRNTCVLGPFGIQKRHPPNCLRAPPACVEVQHSLVFSHDPCRPSVVILEDVSIAIPDASLMTSTVQALSSMQFLYSLLAWHAPFNICEN